MARMGRPTKLDQKVQDDIVLMLKMGNYIETAAAFAGISKTTLYSWMRRGREELERVEEGKGRKIRKAEEPYVDFLNAVEKSMAEAEIRDVQIIYNAAKSDWKASAWRLERKYQDKWGRKDRTEVTGKDGGPIEIDDPREVLLNKLNTLAKRKNDQADDE